jgi:hypothetical protein
VGGAKNSASGSSLYGVVGVWAWLLNKQSASELASIPLVVLCDSFHSSFLFAYKHPNTLPQVVYSFFVLS